MFYFVGNWHEEAFQEVEEEEVCHSMACFCDFGELFAYLRSSWLNVNKTVNMASVDVSVEVLNECQIQEVTLDGQEIITQ